MELTLAIGLCCQMAAGRLSAALSQGRGLGMYTDREVALGDVLIQVPRSASIGSAEEFPLRKFLAQQEAQDFLLVVRLIYEKFVAQSGETNYYTRNLPVEGTAAAF